MKVPAIFLFALLVPACRDTSAIVPSTEGRIAVYVHWEEQPLAGKQIELLPSGEKKLTDSLGRAEFAVPAGSYTIRAYNINRGGPSPRNFDYDVKVRAGETTTLDVVDCLPCV